MTQASLEAPDKRLSLGTILSFSTAALPLSALGVALFVYLAPYFSSHLGVPLAVVGWAWWVVRMLDIGVDVGLGMAMDRTRTRLGRYRVWMILGAPLLILAVYMLFMAPVGIGGGYLVTWLLVYYLATSILGLAHSAWGAKLAGHYHERSRVFGILAAVGVVGALLVLLFPILAKSTGHTAAEGVRAMGWFVIWLTPLGVGLVVWRTPETIAPDAPKERFALRDYWALFKKPDLMRLFLAQMCLTLGPGWMSALYLFFFTISRGFTQEQASILLAVYIAAGVAGALATARLAMRFGKHRTLMAATTAYSLGLCAVFILPRASMPAAVPLMFWCGSMASGFDLMIRAMLADVGDEVRLEQGRERISLIYAVNTLAAKIAAAFALVLTYPLLAALGFDPKEGAVNTAQAIHNLDLTYILGPIVFVMLGGACVIGWRLDADRHGAVRAELEARDSVAGAGGG